MLLPRIVVGVFLLWVGVAATTGMSLDASTSVGGGSSSRGGGGGPSIIDASYRLHYIDVLNTRHEHSEDDQRYTAQQGTSGSLRVFVLHCP